MAESPIPESWRRAGDLGSEKKKMRNLIAHDETDKNLNSPCGNDDFPTCKGSIASRTSSRRSELDAGGFHRYACCRPVYLRDLWEMYELTESFE
jgi:hypothetical protein